MKLRKYFIAAAIFTVSLSVMSGQELFPVLKGYKATSDYPVYTPDDLWDYINGAADGYLAMGFIDLNITEYVKGRDRIKAEIYRFGDDTRAFGMYSMERSPDYRFIQTGVQGYNESGAVNFYKGCYYVKIMTHSKSPRVNDRMLELAGLISSRIEGKNEFPSLLGLFPREGLIQNQETYVLESVLGHEFLRGAFRSSYEVEGDHFDIYLFSCKSSDEASAIAGELAGDAYTPGDDVFKYVFKDGYNGVLHMAQQGDRLVIVSGLDNDSTPLAERYIDMMLRR
jgi:hypothetical protein